MPVDRGEGNKKGGGGSREQRGGQQEGKRGRGKWGRGEEGKGGRGEEGQSEMDQTAMKARSSVARMAGCGRAAGAFGAPEVLKLRLPLLCLRPLREVLRSAVAIRVGGTDKVPQPIPTCSVSTGSK